MSFQEEKLDDVSNNKIDEDKEIRPGSMLVNIDLMDDEERKMNLLYPCIGLNCCVQSFYYQVDNCFDNESEFSCCCFKGKINNIYCKRTIEDDTFCTFCNINNDVECIPVAAVSNYKCRSCCIDTRFSIPYNENIPIILNCCFLTCFYNNKFLFACCENINGIETIYSNIPQDVSISHEVSTDVI